MEQIEKKSPRHYALAIVAWTVFLFLLMPSFIVIPMSFGDSNELMFPPRNWTVNLYVQYFNDREWLAATWLSFRVAIWTTLISLVLGVPAAYGLVRGKFFGQKLAGIFLLSPIMVPTIVSALGIYIYFVDVGINQGELRLVLGLTVATMPFVIITAMSGMRHIDENLERAARIMGAGSLRVLWSVTLPMLRPSLIGGALFAFLMSFDEVVIAWFVHRAGYTTLPVKMFSSIQWEISAVLAAISTLLTVVSIAICLIVVFVNPPEEKQ